MSNNDCAYCGDHAITIFWGEPVCDMCCHFLQLDMETVGPDEIVEEDYQTLNSETRDDEYYDRHGRYPTRSW